MKEEIRLDGRAVIEDGKISFDFSVFDENNKVVGVFNNDTTIDTEPTTFGASKDQVFSSSAIWGLILKDVLAAAGSALIAAVKKRLAKKVEEKVKEKAKKLFSASKEPNTQQSDNGKCIKLTCGGNTLDVPFANGWVEVKTVSRPYSASETECSNKIHVSKQFGGCEFHPEHGPFSNCQCGKKRKKHKKN